MLCHLIHLQQDKLHKQDNNELVIYGCMQLCTSDAMLANTPHIPPKYSLNYLCVSLNSYVQTKNSYISEIKLYHSYQDCPIDLNI